MRFTNYPHPKNLGWCCQSLHRLLSFKSTFRISLKNTLSFHLQSPQKNSESITTWPFQFTRGLLALMKRRCVSLTTVFQTNPILTSKGWLSPFSFLKFRECILKSVASATHKYWPVSSRILRGLKISNLLL